MTAWWRGALGSDQVPSVDQEAAILAPPTGRYCVNAGAGTGKTATLALRTLYLIEAEHLSAEQIVVVTFTKKAAAEIASRIADTLDRAVAGGAPLPTAGRGVECTTIHGLAARLLREYAFEFGAVAPPRAISDGEAYAIFHEAFRALLAGELDVDARLFPIAEINLAGLERDLGKLALRLKNHGIDPPTFAARALAQSAAFAEQSWGQLWTLGAKNKRIARHPTDELSAAERVREAERERANVLVVAALFAAFDRRLAERAAVTYGDLISMTTRLLHERPALVARLRARWRYLLLDESQDTSDRQWEFLEAIFGPRDAVDAAGMMLVGDARQAIYGFNGADERVMQRLENAAHGTRALVVNRRSPQEIVDAAHAVLAAAGVVDRDAPKLAAAAGAHGLGCVRVARFGQPDASIKEHVERESHAIAGEVARLLASGETRPSDIAILVRRRTHTAAYMRALNEAGVAAALDRRSGLFVADEIRDALAWMSLILDLSDRQAAVRILQSPLVGLNDAALIGLAHGNDWLRRLLSNDRDDTLESDVRTRLERFRRWLDALLPAVGLPLRAATRRILTTLPLDASYARLGEAIGAQAIANIRGFAALADAFALDHPRAELADFVADVKRRVLYDDDPPEAELDLDGVRVLTIHQAKGLEWPYVFVACSTKHQYASAEPSDLVVNYDLVSGALALKNDIDGRETLRWQMVRDEHDPHTGERNVQAARKLAAVREQARVFYVALTRAQRRVYVSAPAATAAGEVAHLDTLRTWAASVEATADLGFGSPDAAPAHAAEPAVAPLLRMAPVSERETADPPSVAAQPRLSFTAIAAFATCPRMARFRYRLHLPQLRDAHPRSVDVAQTETSAPLDAARLGSLTHRVLERWGRAKLAGDELPLEIALAESVGEFADVPSNEAERTFASARCAVAALAGFTVLEVETPFGLAVGETRIDGVIDLVARDRDGRLTVIDYKTGRADDGKDALQLALYGRVVKARYPDEAVDCAILRVTPQRATFAPATRLPEGELERTIAQVGSFASDVAKVGSWCTACAYRGSPCIAPFTG